MEVILKCKNCGGIDFGKYEGASKGLREAYYCRECDTNVSLIFEGPRDNATSDVVAKGDCVVAVSDRCYDSFPDELYARKCEHYIVTDIIC
jgi:hypothetical protein